jgi:class 3 adenylate cyclase/tetratricopeptide (TPR) repeat protein
MTSPPNAGLARAPATTSEEAATSPDERRQITVMFCDLVGSVALSQRLDSEDYRDVMRAYRGACKEEVERYEGFDTGSGQFLGDGVMAYFGWPTAHEDSAERSVLSALGIVRAVKSLRAAEPLAVRVGIATGLVVVGGHRGEGSRDAGLAHGGAPNLAARLQNIAGANEVVIADATRRLVGNAFELTDLGALPVKGIDHPVRAWRVDALRRTDGRFEAARKGLPLTNMVGRGEDLAQLLRAWREAREGEGRVVVIDGAAGIGKSRLTRALRERLAGEPVTVLRYQCSPFHVNAALHPVIGQLEHASAWTREDTPESKLEKLKKVLRGSDALIAKAVPLFAALLSLPTGEQYPPLEVSPRKRKEMLLEALADQVVELSKIKPVLIIFEDVHWIDPTSHEALDLLVPRLQALPVLLVVTYRPEHRPEYRVRWSEQQHVRRLGVGRLTRREGEELVNQVTLGRSLPAEVLEKIVSHAEGVPLYVEELTKSVLESGLLREVGDQYALQSPLSPMAVPISLKDSLMARLDRLETAKDVIVQVKDVIHIGACIGREFSHELIARVSALDEARLGEVLDKLMEARLIYRRGTPPDATYTFKHALVRDAAYETLLRSERPGLHKQIADALETEFPQSVANKPEVLAHHRTAAGDLTAAIPLWRKAGESALARVALPEAVAYLQEGLAIVGHSADRDNAELSLRERLHSALLQWRGWATQEVGDNARAILELAQRQGRPESLLLSVRERLHSALLESRGWASPEVGDNAKAILELAQGQGRPQSLLVGLWGMWINTITRGRVAESIAGAEHLLAEGNRSRSKDLQILGHRALLATRFYLAELNEALAERDKVLALYDLERAQRWRELTGNDVRTAAGVFSSQALWMLGHPDQAAQVSDQIVADTRRLGHPFDIGWALTWGTYVLDFRCEPDRLLARVHEAGRVGREQSIPVLHKVLVPAGEGLAMLRMGQLPEAIRLLELGIKGWRDTGGHLNLPYLKSALAEALARQGDVDASLGLLDECLQQIERWGERVWLAEILRLKGWVLMREGRREEAERQLRDSIECARAQQARSWELRSSTTLAELLIERDDRAEALQLLQGIYDWFTGAGKEGLDTHDIKAARTLLEAMS